MVVKEAYNSTLINIEDILIWINERSVQCTELNFI